jgi:hypothetical protein
MRDPELTADIQTAIAKSLSGCRIRFLWPRLNRIDDLRCVADLIQGVEIIIMKWNRIAVLVITLAVAPQIQAEGPFAGASLGLVSSEEADTTNLGFVAGHSPDEGFGFEVFYLNEISDDSASVSGFTGDISTDTWGILAVYKTADNAYFERVYLKGKAGIGVISIEADIDGFGSIKDSESGLALGVAAGIRLGPGDIELSYTIMPSNGKFDELDMDADADIIAVNYLWHL